MVTGVASALRRIRSAQTSKIRACTGSKKCAGCTMLATRSYTSLLTRSAPSSACSASTLWGVACGSASSAAVDPSAIRFSLCRSL